jgi:phosphocarrier protein HPr
MAATIVIIEAENGLHTRPAAEFVKLAKSFASNITVKSGGKDANAKSLFKLQLLGLSKGSELRIEAVGTDDKAAVDSLAGFITSLN